MTQLQQVNYSQILLKENVKRTFEENYLKMLFEKHKELPKSDIVEFIHKAQQVGANPSLNQIFLIERNANVNGQWRKVGTVVFSYNFIQAIANQVGGYDGYTMKTEVIDKFCPVSGEVKKTLAAVCTVKRNGVEFPYTAFYDEYCVTGKDGKPQGTWLAKPYMMIEKCALSGALRRAFPEALSGMYCEEEMESISHETKISDEKNFIETQVVDKIVQKEEKTERVEKIKAEDEDERANSLEALMQILSAVSLGMTAAQKAKIMLDFTGCKSWKEVQTKTLEEIKESIKKLDKHWQAEQQKELTKARSVKDVSFKLE